MSSKTSENILNLTKGLNPDQNKAVESTEGPLLVLAGAGSGKTRVIAYRIANMIQSGKATPDRILALTFTNKAAGEMRERVKEIMKYKDDVNIWIGTFHSLFARILRKNAELIGYKSSFSIYDSGDQKKALKEILKSGHFKLGSYTENTVLKTISQLKSKLITPTNYMKDDPDDHGLKEVVAPLYAEYNSFLKINNAMDFDDLLCNTFRLLQNNAKTLEFYQRKFKYVLVDEFQDTNYAQYQILLLLAKQHNNICAVGDDDQSIYKWRGAEIKNILQYESDFKDTLVVRLEQNYRSTKTILKAANSVIVNNKVRHGKKLWTAKDVGEKITLNLAESDRKEAEYVAENILGEIKRGNKNWGEIAVLYRMNSLSRLLEDSLRSHNIPYTIVGGLKFYERKEVKDVLAYLALLINPDDELNLRRIINYPHRGLGEKTLERVKGFAYENNITFFEALKSVGSIAGIPPRRATAILEFYNMISKYRKMLGKISLVEVVEALVEEAKIIHQLSAESSVEGEERIANVKELLRAIHDYTVANPESSLENYLSEIALVSDIDSWDKSLQRVSLMSVHAAKGLEFPVVFIAGLEDGIFPLGAANDDPELMEEERRLMYVATTRAMDKLYLTAARSRWKFDMVLNNLPSRFISEIDEDTIFKTDSKPAFSFYSKSDEKRDAKKSANKESVARAYQKASSKSSSFTKHKDHGYEVGMKVSHSDFGPGVIKNIEGFGEKAKLVITFDNGAIKKLMVQYAVLNVMDI